MITVLLLSGIFVFGGENKDTFQTSEVVPDTIVSVVEEVW
ncbi:hypothetical protein X927_00590 [Petrotoga mexicana DSM 14811]|uniref:Uncharacterized protein n=1 Tax=Petrotoga mexicana DSM 14811 TaxID=1122954 RepID=A0A2K1PFN3_9BACT|nr:hypothetical protein X927_00590 [Petrotoga mexicana DSM 14811]